MRDHTRPGMVMTGAGLSQDIDELERQLDDPLLDPPSTVEIREVPPNPFRTIDGPYEGLAGTLLEAYSQAAYGKGKERHSRDAPFEEQIICVIERLDIGYNRGQAVKKIVESRVLEKIKGREAAIAELLGAINYLAAKIITMREEDEQDERKESI